MAAKKRTKAKRKTIKKKVKKLSKFEQLQRYTAALEKRLRKYEKQRFVGPLKPGEKRRKPPRTELDAVRSKLKLFLESSKRNLEAVDVASNYRSHENSDYSIDAELKIPVEDSGDFEANMIEIEDSANWNQLSDFWISIGLQTHNEEKTGSPTLDKRPYKPWTNQVRGSRSGAAFFTARETVAKKIEEYGSVITMISIRISWHPDNARPNRPGRK